MSKDSCEAAESAGGTALRMARLNGNEQEKGKYNNEFG